VKNLSCRAELKAEAARLAEARHKMLEAAKANGRHGVATEARAGRTLYLSRKAW